jgi:hypothetical protein
MRGIAHIRKGNKFMIRYRAFAIASLGLLACSSNKLNIGEDDEAIRSASGQLDGGAEASRDAGTRLRGSFEIMVDQSHVERDNGGIDYAVNFSAGTLPTLSDPPPAISEQRGPCHLSVWTNSNGWTPLSLVENAGTLVATGALTPEDGIRIDAEDILKGGKDFQGLRAFLGGESLTFTASGGSLPGFPPRRVKTPSEIQLVSPPTANVPTPVLDRATDLALRWTGGGEGDVNVHLTGRAGSIAGRTSISCSFPAKDGEGRVPREFLAHLPQTDITTGANVLLGVFPYVMDTWKVGNWDYDIVIYNGGVRSQTMIVR